MNEREAYENKIKGQIDEWQAEIDKWSAMAKQAQADAQLQYNEQLQKLRERRDEAQEQLQKLQKASDGAWEDLRKGMEDGWREFGRAIETARERFK
jgi:F0F1-type ATP synthase membrane subunit b/b'